MSFFPAVLEPNRVRADGRKGSGSKVRGASPLYTLSVALFLRLSWRISGQRLPRLILGSLLCQQHSGFCVLSRFDFLFAPFKFDLPFSLFIRLWEEGKEEENEGGALGAPSLARLIPE